MNFDIIFDRVIGHEAGFTDDQGITVTGLAAQKGKAS